MLLSKIDFLGAPSTSAKPSVAPEDADEVLSVDEEGFPTVLISPAKGSKRTLLPRGTDESNITLDSNGFPSLLRKVNVPEPELPLLSKLELKKPLKKPAAVMKKPAATMKATMKATKIANLKDKNPLTMNQRLKLKPEGCSKCRGVPGCTPSCWKGRGLQVEG